MATHIRRELLDLARRFQCRSEINPSGPSDEESGLLAEVPAPEVGRDEELELWTAFHERVEHLPVEEREVMSLIFYHGWTQAQIDELFYVDERTIRRRWRSACQRLTEALGGQLPPARAEERCRSAALLATGRPVVHGILGEIPS